MIWVMTMSRRRSGQTRQAYQDVPVTFFWNQLLNIPVRIANVESMTRQRPEVAWPSFAFARVVKRDRTFG